ncbi:MAG: hypothetical protein M3383_04340 [Actinomycetota bacterium]|nr:hypothetical protein [Actinomycetota bacterium]
MNVVAPEGLLHLAQYQPFTDGGLTREEVFRRMVGPTLMEAGGAVVDPSELRDAFSAFWGVEVETAEVDGWLDHLEEVGAIERTGGGVAISPSARTLLEKRRQEFDQLSALAINEWRATLVEIEPELEDDELDALVSDLHQLIGLIVAYHGAEAAVILFPEEERSEALRATLRAKAETLPSRGGRCAAARRLGFARLFGAPTDAQRRFLADRLDHGFFAVVGTLRPEAAAIMKEELRNQRIYLDTNVLIPALGLANRKINESTRRLLRLTLDLEIEIAVTPWTLDELRHSLDRASSEVTRNGLPARQYAGILAAAARQEGGVSLVEGFYESYAVNGSGPGDWFRKAAQIEPRLAELGITLVADGVLAVEKQDRDRVNDYVVLLDREATFRRGRPRDNPPLLHDARHRALIERLRGEGHRQFRTAEYWFLTEDKVLPRLGQLARDGEPSPKIPFCMSAGAWAQIVRCFTPRTADYEQTVVDLLASPYLRFGTRRRLGDIQDAVARITTLLEDASPTVVAAFVSDETLEAVAGAPEEEKDLVAVRAYERAQDEVEQRFHTVQERMRRLQERLAEQEASRIEVADDAASVRESERLTRAALELERSKAAETERQLERQRTETAAEIERLEGRLEGEKRERAKERARARRYAALAVALLVAITSIALTVAGLTSVAVGVVGGGTAIALIVASSIEQSKLAWTMTFVLAVVGVLLAVVQLLES